jgi:hypothetical protein
MTSLEQQVARLNAELMARVAGHADMLAEYFDPGGDALAVIRAHRIPQALPDRLQVPPPLFPSQAQHRIARAHAAFRAALSSIFERRMCGQWERLADELRLSDATRRYLSRNRWPRWPVIARPDCVLNGDAITMVEPNGGSSSGGMPDNDMLGRVFAAAPVIGDFLRDAGAAGPDAMGTVAGLLRSLLGRAGRSPDGLVLVSDLRALLDRAEPGQAEPGHVELFASELRRHGLHARAGAAEDIECGPRSVTWRGQRVDLIYRFWAGQPDPLGQHPVLEPLLLAARAGSVILLDDLDDQIATTKAALVLLSEELDAGNLPTGLARELAGLVPWSRFLVDGPVTVDGQKVDLLSWSVANQGQLVLKPCHGYAGRGVTIGCEASPPRWASAIGDALATGEPWLVQLLVAGDTERIGVIHDGTIAAEHTVASYGYFAVGNDIPGLIRRSPPFGRPSKLVVRSAHGPVFFV